NVVDQVPDGASVVRSKWVFRKKGPMSFKARLVAKGYSEKYGIDYSETYSPVVRHSSIRLLVALAVKNGWSIDQMDVVTAFLQAKLEEDIYMKFPADPFLKGGLCKLNRAVYGLKQSNKSWNSRFTSY